MRINLYSQELTNEVRMISKEGADDRGQLTQFYGVRMMLVSAPTLHHTPHDDDRSAVTFWLPKSAVRRKELAGAFREMARLVELIALLL